MGTVTFADLLITHRHARRLSHANLAHDTGLTRSHMSRLESGQRQPSRETVEKLAAALGLDELDEIKFYAAGGFWPPRLDLHVALIGWWPSKPAEAA